MPRLALRRPRRVCNSPLQHREHHSPEGPCRIAGARARTRSIRPIDATRIQACPGGPADSTRNASFMLDASWPALLAALCFLLTTKLSAPLFGDVVGALQALARAAGYLALRTPCDAFLTALAKATFPPRIVAALDEPPQAQKAPPCRFIEDFTLGLAGSSGGSGSGGSAELSARNLACLHELVAAAMFLAGSRRLRRSRTVTSIQHAVRPRLVPRPWVPRLV